MTPDTDDTLRAQVELKTLATYFLGERYWFLVAVYGRMMSGPHIGNYVSALAPADSLELVMALAEGDLVPVHLMQLHGSGRDQPSNLRLRDGQLFMVFADHEELV